LNLELEAYIIEVICRCYTLGGWGEIPWYNCKALFKSLSHSAL